MILNISMSRFVLITLIICTIQAEDSKTLGTITLPLGNVSSRPPGKYTWIKSRVNQNVVEEEKIRTLTKSRCEITLDSKRILRIGEQSMVTLSTPEDGQQSYNMKRGKVWLSILSKRNNIQVFTPTAIAGIRGTVFHIECNNSYSTISVREGSVTVTPIDNNGSTLDTLIIVESGNELNIVNNFEDYMQEQMREMEQFKDQDERLFQQFIRDQNMEYQNFLDEERKSFREFQSVFISQQSSDNSIDNQSEWIQWNLDRDALIEK